MGEPAITGMTPAEFFVWEEQQEILYELVRGQPVPRSMTGATRRHDRVLVNAIAAFMSKLRGGPCRPMTDDIAVVSPNSNVRRPDMTIDCGVVDLLARSSPQPVLILEILSPSTAYIDKLIKLEEYKALPSLRYILIAETESAHVLLYVRGTEGVWTSMSHIGVDSVLEFPELGCALALSELYEDTPAAARPDTGA